MSRSPAVDVAKEQTEREPLTLTLTSGVRVRVKPVSAYFRDDARSRIPDPPVPVYHDASEDRDVPNPDDPAYLAALQDAGERRAAAAMDAIVMFGLELVDGVPPAEQWLPRLEFMQRRGMIDLAGYDLAGAIDLEYLYKRFVVVTDADWALLGPGIQLGREEAAARAEAIFRRARERDADHGGGAEKSA